MMMPLRTIHVPASRIHPCAFICGSVVCHSGILLKETRLPSLHRDVIRGT